MLIEFKVENFQCFRDEVVLDFQPAGKDKSLRGNIWQGNRYRALKSIAILGANASGKTTLLHALYVLSRLVEESATKMTIGDPVPGMNPFRLSSHTRDQPCRFEVLVEIDGVGYSYRVEATEQRVCGEVLERQGASPYSNWIRLIDRGNRTSEVVIHDELIGSKVRREQIIQDTRDNALILSRAAERNVQPVLPLFKWFGNCVGHLYAGSGSAPDEFALRHIARDASEDTTLLDKLTALIRDADTGIVDLNTESSAPSEGAAVLEETDGSDDLPSEVREAIADFRGAYKRVAKLMKLRAESANDIVNFYTMHRTSEGSPVAFALNEESHGTRRYLHLLGRLLRHCATADLLAVDELHTSLHPELARRAIQMAHSPQYGTHGAQLIFTTHDVSVLDPQLLRRDQIVLTQKGVDGASELYSLWDFESMPRNTAAWAKNYLAGRFGAVPVFGPSLASISQASEPTAVDTGDGTHSVDLETTEA
jgi:hypothetical protein